MTNDFFNLDNPLSRQTLARAEGANTIFEAVATGFDKLPNLSEIIQGRVTYAVDTGTANAILVALPKTMTAYTDGAIITVKLAASNTGATTINVDGLGAVPVKLFDGTDPDSGDLVVGDRATLIYSGADSHWRMMSHQRSYGRTLLTEALENAADVWVSGGAFTINDRVYSPVNFQKYVAITTHSGVAIDPSLDTTNWQADSVEAPIVYQSTKTDTASTSSDTFTDTGLEVTLTPSSASNKFLLLCNLGQVTNPNGNSGAQFRFVRDGAAIGVGAAAGNRAQVGTLVGNGDIVTAGSMMFLDAPATASAITYKVQWARSQETSTAYLNRDDSDSNSTDRARSISTLQVVEVQ